MSDTAEIPQKPRKSREANRQEWADRLARFDQSGLTVLDFCRAEGVAPQSFYLWKRRLAASAEPPAPEFLPIRLAPTSPVEIVLPNGAALRLSPGCDLAFVRSLVQALAGSGPCRASPPPSSSGIARRRPTCASASMACSPSSGTASRPIRSRATSSSSGTGPPTG